LHSSYKFQNPISYKPFHLLFLFLNFYCRYYIDSLQGEYGILPLTSQPNNQRKVFTKKSPCGMNLQQKLLTYGLTSLTLLQSISFSVSFFSDVLLKFVTICHSTQISSKNRSRKPKRKNKVPATLPRPPFPLFESRSNYETASKFFVTHALHSCTVLT
jgi:hypothetical protein